MAEPLALDRRKTAVLVIDMQNAFMDPQGSLGRMGVPMDRTRLPVPHVQRLLRAARAAAVPVVHLRFVLRPDLAVLGMLGRAFPPLRALGHCAEGSWDAAFFPGMEPAAGDHVLAKSRLSGFHGTGLDTLLRCLAIDIVVVAGVATNVCVKSTVRDAFQRDDRVVVPRETTGSYTEAMTAASLEGMAFMLARAAGLDEVLAALAEATAARSTWRTSGCTRRSGWRPPPGRARRRSRSSRSSIPRCRSS